MADFRKACTWEWELQLSARFASKGDSIFLITFVSSGNTSKACLSCARSLGLAERRATLARILSISPISLRGCNNLSAIPGAIRVSTACCLFFSMSLSRIGRFSHLLSSLLPIGVAQRSIRPAREYSLPGVTLISISRFRRVSESIMTASSRRSRVSPRR